MGEMPAWLVLVLICMATYRMTRFITTDAFPLVAGPRRWIDTQWNPFPAQDAWDSYRKAPKTAQDIVVERLVAAGIKSRPTGLKRSIAYLIGCSWCTSIWVSAGITIICAVSLNISWLHSVLIWLTASAVTGLISQREPE